MSFAVIFTLYCSFSAALSWEMGIKHTLLRFRTSLPIPRFLSKTPKSTATWPMTVLSFSKSNESMFMLWWLSPSSFSYIWVDRGIPMYSEPSTTIRWFSFFSNTFSEEASESSTGRCHGDRCCCAGWTWKRATHKKRVSHHAYVGRKSREVDARKSRRHLGMHTAFEKRYKSSSDPRSSRHLTYPTISSDLPNLRQIRVCSASLSLPKSSTIAANVRHGKKKNGTRLYVFLSSLLVVLENAEIRCGCALVSDGSFQNMREKHPCRPATQLRIIPKSTWPFRNSLQNRPRQLRWLPVRKALRWNPWQVSKHPHWYIPRLLSQNVIKALPVSLFSPSLHLSAQSAFLQNLGHSTPWVLLFEKNRNDYRGLFPSLFLHLFPPKEHSY